MRLDFKILWIDDQPKHVKSFAEGIEFKLDELGFALDVVKLESLTDAENLASEHIHSDGIDLVMVDFDLGTGAGGAEALQAIRKCFPYKEVVFYSAKDTKELRKIAYDANVDGIVFSTRLSLVTDTIQVIENMLRRVMDIDHMRGVVMSATSDIDFLVEHTLLALYEKLDEEKQKEFRSQLCKDLEKKINEWTKDLTKAQEKATLEALLKLKHILTAMDRIKHLGSCLEPMAHTTSYHGKITEYSQNVVPRRNKLAHVILKRDSGKSAFSGTEKFDLEDLTRLRKDLIEHRNNFHTIAVLLDVQF